MENTDQPDKMDFVDARLYMAEAVNNMNAKIAARVINDSDEKLLKKLFSCLNAVGITVLYMINWMRESNQMRAAIKLSECYYLRN